MVCLTNPKQRSLYSALKGYDSKSWRQGKGANEAIQWCARVGSPGGCQEG